MPLPRASLRSFLFSAKAALKNVSQQSSPVTFVIGNESADLDSLCSAVVLAYLRTYAPTSKSDTLYIPISNIPRAELSLRTELIPVLSHANIKPSDLITLSDLPPITQTSSQIPPERTRWLLVDHNALTGELGKLYGARVVGCIDHHEEEHKVPKDCGEESRIVEKCGSCCSLIVEYCKGGWDSLASKSTDNEATSWNAELARVTLGPIIVDTTNLTSKEKTTPTDVKAVEYLEKWIYTKERNTYNRDVYFKQLSKAKEDLGHLSLTDILRKDYKKWTEAKDVVLGTSAVVKCMSWILQKTADKEEFLAVVKDFAQERNLSICSIMTTSHSDDGVFRRELFVWALNKKAVKAAKKFEAEAREKLGLIQWNDGSLDLDGDEQWRRCWWQERIENSRKQVAPLLRTSIEEAA